jgi:glycosyltransferase involved in cell wall biosynthesis
VYKRQVPHRLRRNPGQRFRFEQYLSHLSEAGIEYNIANLLDERDDVIFYSQGHYFQKAILLGRSFVKRLRHVRNAKNYSIVFVYREAFMTGTTFFERRLKESGAKFIYDFDDAIWLPDVSQANKRLAFLKRPTKTNDIISIADLVLAGNDYLKKYALRFNSNVELMPTTVDTDEYKPRPLALNKRLVIGWSGSPTTVPHFHQAEPIFFALKEKYGDKIEFCVIGDGNYFNEKLGVRGMAWTLEKELETINSFDIGVMPLPDNEWTRGKCGLKGLTYMAFEKPTVMQNIGVNQEIIDDGINGFLATTPNEWIEKLSLLIESPELRIALGKAGRETVVKRYSVNAWKDKYVSFFLR